MNFDYWMIRHEMGINEEEITLLILKHKVVTRLIALGTILSLMLKAYKL